MTVQTTDAVFRALTDPTRRAILQDLRLGAKPVNEIALRFAMSRPAVSKHLRVLRAARLVTHRKDGRQRICMLDPRPLREVDSWLNDFRAAWQARLGALKDHVESEGQRALHQRRQRS